MNSTTERAKVFFHNPDLYLTKNYDISLRAAIVKQLLGEINNCRILDLGCGDGTISSQFLPANNHVTMVDMSAEMLERAKRATPEEYVAQVEYVHSDIA